MQVSVYLIIIKHFYKCFTVYSISRSSNIDSFFCSTATRLRVSQADDQIILVPKGSTFMVDEFNDAVALDGYRWARVRIDLDESKAGFYSGWIQYDPAVMYPYSVGN